MEDEALPPRRDIRRVEEAQQRLETAVMGLDDAGARRPTELPGWTVGHLLTHVARNADSHARRAEAAARGDVVDQYPGGVSGRRQQIEDGALRSADELVGDVRQSAQRVHRIWLDLPARAWSVVTRDVGGRERPLHDLPARRWQELEVHIVDLGVGITVFDWSDDFVSAWLPRLRRSLTSRLAASARLPEPLGLSEREELGWLYGRLRFDDLPVLAPWG